MSSFTWWRWNWKSEEWEMLIGRISSLDPEWMWNHPENQPLRNGGEIHHKKKLNLCQKTHTRIREFENKLTQREFDKWWLEKNWMSEMDVRVWRE